MGSLRKYQGSEQDVSVCALVNIKWFGFNKRSCVLWLRFGVSSLSSPSPPQFPVTRRIPRKAGYISKCEVLSVKQREGKQGCGSTALLILNPDIRCIRVVNRRPRLFYLAHTLNRHLGESREENIVLPLLGFEIRIENLSILWNIWYSIDQEIQ